MIRFFLILDYHRAIVCFSRPLFLYFAEAERMSDWLLVVACMSDRVPTVEALRAALQSDEFAHRSQAARRLVVLNREQLCNMYGPTFAQRSRLFVEAPVGAAADETDAADSPCTANATRLAISHPL